MSQETRLTADLPGLTLELRHRAADAEGPERIVLALQANDAAAVPDPVALWAGMVRAAWAPWFALWGWGAPPRLR